MKYESVTIPIYVEIRAGAIKGLEHTIKNVVGAENPVTITGERSGKVIEKETTAFHHLTIKEPYDFPTLKDEIVSKNYDIIVACGGGRILDIGKYLSSLTSLPVLTVPTLLSSDAISSPISILRIDGEYKKSGTVLPQGVVIDLDVIRESPPIYTKAGLGDLVSNLSATYDWKLAQDINNEEVKWFSYYLARGFAERILNTEGTLKDDELIKELAEGLVMSGIAMNAANSSRPASGSEHNISHALDKILKNKNLHGIQVGLATLLTTYLQGQYRVYEKIKALFERVDFPLNIREAGIKKEEFIKALELAPNIRERVTILNKCNVNEIVSTAKKLEIV